MGVPKGSSMGTGSPAKVLGRCWRMVGPGSRVRSCRCARFLPGLARERKERRFENECVQVCSALGYIRGPWAALRGSLGSSAAKLGNQISHEIGPEMNEISIPNPAPNRPRNRPKIFHLGGSRGVLGGSWGVPGRPPEPPKQLVFPSSGVPGGSRGGPWRSEGVPGEVRGGPGRVPGVVSEVPGGPQWGEEGAWGALGGAPRGPGRGS